MNNIIPFDHSLKSTIFPTGKFIIFRPDEINKYDKKHIEMMEVYSNTTMNSELYYVPFDTFYMNTTFNIKNMIPIEDLHGMMHVRELFDINTYDPIKTKKMRSQEIINKFGECTLPENDYKCIFYSLYSKNLYFLCSIEENKIKYSMMGNDLEVMIEKITERNEILKCCSKMISIGGLICGALFALTNFL